MFSDGLAAVRVGAEWGFIDRTGAYAISRQFTTRPDDFSDGMAAIRTAGQLTGFIDKTGAIAIGAPVLAPSLTRGVSLSRDVDGGHFLEGSAPQCLSLPQSNLCRRSVEPPRAILTSSN